MGDRRRHYRVGGMLLRGLIGGAAPTINAPSGPYYVNVNYTFSVTTALTGATFDWTNQPGVTVVSGQGTSSAVVRFTDPGVRSIVVDITGSEGQNRRAAWIDNVSSFAPISVAGCQLWFDSADSSTIVLDGSNNVDTFKDKSGYARDVTQTATARPSYQANVQNGLPGLLFDGVNDGFMFRPPATNPATWFLVWKWSGVNVDSRFLGNRSLRGIGMGISVSTSWNASFVREGIAWIPSGFSQGTTTRIIRTTYTSTDSTFWTYSEGVETQRSTTTATGTVGASWGYSAPGHLFELIQYEAALSAGDISAIETYLANKWGVA